MGRGGGGCWYCGVCVCVGVLASEMGWEAKEEEGGAGGVCVCWRVGVDGWIGGVLVGEIGGGGTAINPLSHMLKGMT